VANYGTEQGFEDYCLTMGYTPTDGDVVPALSRATLWLDNTYGSRYPGKPTGGRAQELGWPRTGARDCKGFVIPPDEIPIEIERSTYEATLRELASPNSLSPDVVAGQVKKSVSISGAVSVDYAVGEGAGGVVSSQQPTLTVVDNMLSCLLAGGQSGQSMTKWLNRA
jgi:Putative DnaT-like ssDNA binding protein